MSGVETETKPLLKSLIGSKQAQISADDLARLRKWMFLKCIVMDHKSTNNRAIPTSDAHNLRIHGTVPAYFKMGLALCGEEPCNLCFNQYTTHMPGVRALVKRDGIANIRLLSLGFEQLYIIAAINRSSLIRLGENAFRGLKLMDSNTNFETGSYDLPRIDSATANSHVTGFKSYVEFPPFASAMKTAALQQGYVTREELDADLVEDRLFGYP